MHANAVFQKSPDFVFRKIGDEMVIVPIRSDTADLDSIFSLNTVAGRVYELVDGQRTLSSIKTTIMDEFEVEDETISKDLKELINSFLELGAVKRQ